MELLEGQSEGITLLGSPDRLMGTIKSDRWTTSKTATGDILGRIFQIEQDLKELAAFRITNRGETLHWLGW
jgi:hypothetical protein